MKQTNKKSKLVNTAVETKEEIVLDEKKPKRKIYLFVLGLLVTMFILFLSYSCWYISSFSKSGNTSPKAMVASFIKGLSVNTFEISDEINILVLGKDDFSDEGEGSTLTDTIMLVSIHKSGSIVLLPFPRDLWIDPLKTKINALYYYGEKSQEITGSGLVEKTIEEISGQEIHHTVVINIGILEEIIEVLGSITVDIDTAFTDDQYPNNKVPPDIFPIELRYETVIFEEGKQKMDGPTAIKYIRSRQSTNENENTDNARSKRQQKVITAIVNKISSKDILLDPSITGELYGVWKEGVQTSLTDKDLVGIAKDYIRLPISFYSLSIPVQSLESDGILFNPPIYKYKQWVYLPHDPSWLELQSFIDKNLHQNK